jgi:hypothetical protein
MFSETGWNGVNMIHFAIKFLHESLVSLIRVLRPVYPLNYFREHNLSWSGFELHTFCTVDKHTRRQAVTHCIHT